MFQVAFYGKGGIGKSTVTANVSVQLAGRGRRVMQVGCDPKHDSTRLLLGGRSQTTVLDYVRSTPLARRRLEDVVVKGTAGVLCTEAGGPEPGIGCAGRGIMTTFESLERLGADDLDVDIRLYDVLGDVVCGGFAVPLRGGYADAVVLVTSGEFMAMYAANNIMRGLANFDTGSPRLLGIVLNGRGVQGESERVEAFAEATGTRVIAEVPRDGLFFEAESRGHTLSELFPDSEAASRLSQVADAILDAAEGRLEMTYPRPLDDRQLSDLAAGRPIREHEGIPVRTGNGCRGCIRRTSITEGRPLISCAAYGAVSACLKVCGVATIVHGPASCAYLMETSRAKAVLELFRQGIYDMPPEQNMRCTMLDEGSAVFGGAGRLKETLESVVSEGFRDIAVVTTCMPGITGDDCRGVVDGFTRRHPGTRVHLIESDGDMTGDYNDGFMSAAESLAGMMDPDVEQDDSLVNLVGTSFFDIQTRRNLEFLDRMLSVFGMRVNCRFLDETTSERIELFCRAGTDILTTDTRSSRDLMDVVRRRTGRESFPVPMPVGLYQYQEWVDAVGRYRGMEDVADVEIGRSQAEYDSFIDSHRSFFEGRRVLIAARASMNVDWVVDVLDDLGADILRIGFSPGPRMREAVSRHSSRITPDYTGEDLAVDVREMHPDLLVTDGTRTGVHGVRSARIGRMGVGYRSAMEFVTYLEDTVRLPDTEGWRWGA